ncbi:hypothetical protein [Streptomyces anulatus]|uniref:hypothetical protein n=1 Tax=Streptomyces anulatus TaxID=1892 RepID=UPI0004C5A376
MTIASDDVQRDAAHYRAMRDIVEQMRERIPGKFEITKEGIVHDMMAPGRPHELTAAQVRLTQALRQRRLLHVVGPDTRRHHRHSRDAEHHGQRQPLLVHRLLSSSLVVCQAAQSYCLVRFSTASRITVRESFFSDA